MVYNFNDFLSRSNFEEDAPFADYEQPGQDDVIHRVKNIVTSFKNELPSATTAMQNYITRGRETTTESIVSSTLQEMTSRRIDQEDVSTTLSDAMQEITTSAFQTSTSVINDVMQGVTTPSIIVDNSGGLSTSAVLNDTMLGITNTPILNESFSSNSSVVGFGNGTLTEMMDSNANTTFFGNMGTNLNNTLGMDSMGNDNTGMMFNNTAFTETVSSTTGFVDSVSETVSTTTEKVIETFTEYLEPCEHDCGNEIEDKTLYIVLGVILVVLFMMMIILLVIYKKYKLGSARSRYCVKTFDSEGSAGCAKPSVSC